MTPEVQTDNLVWAFRGLLCMLFIVVWWMIRAYRTDMREREEKKEKAQEVRDARLELRDKELQGCIDGLKDSIWGLRELFVLRKDYDRDMKDLKMRRANDICPLPDCPWEDRTEGGLVRIDLSGSGAKPLADLLGAANRHREAMKARTEEGNS